MKRIAFLFPGQGTQYVGMGKILYREYIEAKKTFDEASSVLGFDVYHMCVKGRMVDLNKLENMFTAILTYSVAAFRAYMKEIGIVPKLVAGHSLGEYSALVCSGVITFADALKIVRYRGQLAQKEVDKNKAIMAVVDNMDATNIQNELRVYTGQKNVSIACHNTPNQTVIAGDIESIMALQDKWIDAGAQVTPMYMSAPFHSPYMKEAAEALKQELTKYKFKTPRWPVISNYTAMPYTDADSISRFLTYQLHHPVRWIETINYLKKQQIDLIIEMGSQAILSNMLNDNTDRIHAISYGQKDDRVKLYKMLNMQDKIFNTYFQERRQKYSMIDRCLATVACTLNYSENNDTYLNRIETLVSKIEDIQEKIDQEGKEPTYNQMRDTLDILIQIFKVKKIPLEEQKKRVEIIFKEFGISAYFSDRVNHLMKDEVEDYE